MKNKIVKIFLISGVVFGCFLVVSVYGAECGPSPTWFDCGNGMCISYIWLCDGENDCGNLKDEEDCEIPLVDEKKCLSSQFECISNKHCIPERCHCDGEKDCEDGSDEVHCNNITEKCPGFTCRNRHCIPLKGHCDGNNDCEDGSDEEFCTLGICEEDPPSLSNGKTKEFSRANGSIVNYECNEDYEMIGNSSVHCAFGSWKGQPPDCKLSLMTMEGSGAIETESDDPLIEIKTPKKSPFVEEECFCSYDYKNNIFLKAYWRDREIASQDRIPRGEKVSLVCENKYDIIWPNGLRIFEKMEMICDPCHDWQARFLPQCEPRVTGDSFAVYDIHLKLLPGGIIQVPKSKRVSIMCFNPFLQPRWDSRTTRKINFHEEFFTVRQTRFFSEIITIEEMDYEHNGKYECFASHDNQKLRSTIVHLKIPGTCMENPPSLTNGKTKEFSRANGSTVKYECNKGYEMVGSSSVHCAFGTWKGQPPHCKTWTCEEDPPSISNGKPKEFSRTNGSIINYECDKDYEMVGNSSVHCAFGMWKGQPPDCKSLLCTERPPSIAYGSPVVNNIAHGSIIWYRCHEGYHRIKHGNVICNYGKWEGPTPVCVNFDCVTPTLSYGDIKELRIGDSYWNWQKFRYDRPKSYVKIAAGTFASDGSSLTLFCHKGYSFKGGSEGKKEITCLRGTWHPEPVCLSTPWWISCCNTHIG